MLFVTGNKDEIVPHEMTKSLFNNATKAQFKRIYIVEGGTHNDTWIRRRKEYMQQLKDFMEACNAAQLPDEANEFCDDYNDMFD